MELGKVIPVSRPQHSHCTGGAVPDDFKDLCQLWQSSTLSLLQEAWLNYSESHPCLGSTPLPRASANFRHGIMERALGQESGDQFPVHTYKVLFDQHRKHHWNVLDLSLSHLLDSASADRCQSQKQEAGPDDHSRLK